MRKQRSSLVECVSFDDGSVKTVVDEKSSQVLVERGFEFVVTHQVFICSERSSDFDFNSCQYPKPVIV